MMDPVPPAEPTLTALLVEDDARLAALTAEYLSGHGVVVTRAPDGQRGLEEALRGRYDVVLLDLMLPGKDGLEVCRELLARIRAAVRRARGRAGPVLRTLKVGRLLLDPGARRAALGGKDLPLTG